MNDLRNPYIAGAPVVESSMFFGREDVFNWIENSLSGKYVDHILVLHGQRRVGKTTVLKQIPNFLSKEYIQVFFDLQGRTNTTLDRFLWWMASEIVRTLNKQEGTKLSRPDRRAFTDTEDFISTFLPQIHENLDGQTLLLTFDEFDTLARPDIQESLAQPLIIFLRRLFDFDYLNFIFSIGSSGNKLENMQAAYTDFFKTALYRKVSFLTESECVKLITEPVKGIITYKPDAVNRISQVTSGHPYFTQLTCHELFARCQTSGSRQITLQDVDDILDDVIERGTVNLKFVWDEATDLEKWILAALAREESLTQKKIGGTLRDLGVRFSQSDLNSAVLHLRDKDVLTQENSFVIRLMKRWLEKNRPMDRVREELVQTNPIADRYLEIGDEYLDREELEPAITSYQQALSVQANNLKALYNIGTIYLEQERYQQAASHFSKALQVDEEHIASRQGFCQAYLTLGDRARQDGDQEAAINAYQSILNLTPVHAEARQNLADIFKERAEAHLSSGDDQDGLESLRHALEMTPEDKSLKERYQQVIDQKKSALVQSWLDKAEKALNRKRWDEASRMADKALEVDPEDDSLQVKVAKIKDAPRQAKLTAYRREAEQAIENQNFTKATNAIEAALLLAPENGELQDWLKAAQADQQQARLDHFNAKAAQAIKDGDWEGAVTARESALEVDPENEELIQALADTRAAKRQAQINILQNQIQTARDDFRWEAAIEKANQLLELAPEESQWRDLLEELKTAQYQAHLQDLLEKAETAYQNEAWAKAIQAWEAYLQEEPDDQNKFQDRLAHARQYAQIKADYQKAQGLIKNKRFDRAIPLLQGIIAQDPTYQSTSRLLVEAVEARQQRTPKIKPLWLLSGLVIIALIALGVSFRTQITQFITGLFQFQPEVEAASLEPLPFSGNNTAEPENEQERFSSEVHAYMAQTPPTFEDDFSSGKTEWGLIETPVGSWPVSDFIEGNAFHLDFNDSEAVKALGYFKTTLPNNDLFSRTDFIFSLKTNPATSNSSYFPGLIFNASEDLAEYYELNILLSKLVIIHYNDKGNEVLQSIEHGYDFQVEELNVIAYRDTLSIEINGETIIHMQRPEITGDNNYLFLTTNAPPVEHVKFWNLEEETILSEEILTLIESHLEAQEPTLSDDFSTPDAKWGNLIRNDETLPAEDYISNGVLRLTAENQAIQFPEGDTINSGHFALDFDYFPVSFQETGQATKISFLFRAAPDTSSYYALDFYPADDLWQVTQLADNSTQVLDQGSFEGASSHSVRLMVYQQHSAIFLDEVRVFSSNSLVSEDETNLFYIAGIDDWQINFGHLSFWNLEEIEIGAVEASSGALDTDGQNAQTEEHETDWMNDFTQPILNFIETQPAKIENDFDSINNGNYYQIPNTLWLMDIHSHNTLEIQDGQLVLRDSAMYLHDFSYKDFVLEIDLEQSLARKGILFHNQECEIQFNLFTITASCNDKELMRIQSPEFLEEFYNLQLIVKGKYHFVFLNGSPYGYFEFENQGTEGLRIFTNFMNSRVDLAQFDNIKIWDISDVIIDAKEPASAAAAPPTPTEGAASVTEETLLMTRTINDYMLDNPPTLEDDFSNEVLEWVIYDDNDNDSVDNKLSEGALSNEKLNLFDENIFYSTDDLNEKNFVISADINYPYDYNDGFVGGVRFSLFANEDRSEFLDLNLSYEGYQMRQKFKNNYQEISNENYGYSPVSIAHIQLISFDNTLSLLVGPNIIFSKEISEIAGDKIFISGTDGIMLDNFKFWSLDGVFLDENALSDAIFAYSDNTIPTFEDDFSTQNDAWGTIYTETSGNQPLYEFVEDEELIFTGAIGMVGFPGNNLLDASDFILSFELSPDTAFDNLFYFFRSSETPLSSYIFILDDSTGNYRVEMEELEQITSLKTGSVGQLDLGTTYRVIIFAKDKYMAIFWDGELIYYDDNATLSGSNNRFTIWSFTVEKFSSIHFDNFRFWNLEGVAFE